MNTAPLHCWAAFWMTSTSGWFGRDTDSSLVSVTFSDVLQSKNISVVADAAVFLY
jgi:hypothetical protein